MKKTLDSSNISQYIRISCNDFRLAKIYYLHFPCKWIYSYLIMPFSDIDKDLVDRISLSFLTKYKFNDGLCLNQITFLSSELLKDGKSLENTCCPFTWRES